MILHHFSHWKFRKYWIYFRRCSIFLCDRHHSREDRRKRHFTNIKWNSKVHFIYFINENIHCYISLDWQLSIIMKHARAVWHGRAETEAGCLINCNIFVCLILFIFRYTKRKRKRQTHSTIWAPSINNLSKNLVISQIYSGVSVCSLRLIWFKIRLKECVCDFRLFSRRPKMK